MDAHAIDAAAERLARLRLSARPLDMLPAGRAPVTLEEAYAVQDRLATRLSAGALGAVAGRKIGCTTRVMQEYLKISHPCAGAMFAATLREADGTFEGATLCRPGVECEIAVRLSDDLSGDGPLEAADVAPHVACAMASIELVDDRWTDFSAVPTPVLVADNFFNAGCVLGPSVAMDPAGLAALAGEMHVNGERVGTGRGSDILGDPLAALAWLAGHQRAMGDPLKAGDVVTLGSLVKTAWIGPGDVVDIEIERLGRCRLVIA